MDLKNGLPEFFAIWFQNLKQHIFKTEIVSPKLDRFLDKHLNGDSPINDIRSLVKELVSISGKNIKVDLSNVKFPSLTHVDGAVKVINFPSPQSSIGINNFPTNQKVNGIIDIANFPKDQKVNGGVEITNIDKIIQGLQVVVDAINDLKMTQGVGGGSTVVASSMGGARNNDKIKGTTLFDPDDSAPIYVGIHESSSANTSDGGWEILKYTYSGANVTRITRKAGAVWSNRATLF